MINTESFAAVTLAYPVQMIIGALSTGIGVGINSSIARSLGSKEYGNASKAALNGLLLGFGTIAIMILFGLFGSEPCIRFYTDDPMVIEAGTIYVRTISLLAVGNVFTQITFSILQGSGNMKDIAHYFVKFYGRWRVPRTSNNALHQKQYAKLRMADLDTVEDDVLQAFTRCTDLDALNDLLYAYYHLGDVRNATNHAADEAAGFVGLHEESDMSVRMNMISQAVDYFIASYDKVAERLDSSKPIVTVSNEEIVAQARTMRPSRSFTRR